LNLSDKRRFLRALLVFVAEYDELGKRQEYVAIGGPGIIEHAIAVTAAQQRAAHHVWVEG